MVGDPAVTDSDGVEADGALFPPIGVLSLYPECMDRFWSKVEKTDGCWLWTGGVTGRGYGNWRESPGGKTHGVHRLAYELLVGPIPDGLTIDHLCKVKTCCNPDHMDLVTVRENILRSKVRTHCPAGHEYTVANNIKAKSGGLKCRTCHNARRRVGARVR